MSIIITIPEDTKCLLKSGQAVDFLTPFLENKVISDIAIPVAKKLNIASDKIFNYLIKFVGDSVEKNDIIAEKKSLLGNTSIVSETKGIIKEINHNSGEMVISTSIAQKGHISAYFKGEVIDIEKKQLKLKAQEVREFTCKQTASDFGGETFYLQDTSKSIFAPQMSNKIMITESITPYLLTKAEALGIKGFISLKNPPQDSNLAKVQIKNIDDFKKIFHLNLPYCLINKQYSKIYFYR